MLTQATPLTIAKQIAADLGRRRDRSRRLAAPGELRRGSSGRCLSATVNGSLGETCALALLIGGLFLCLRRVASWEIPVGMLLAGFLWPRWPDGSTSPRSPRCSHLISGSFLFGAFFIATDPVTSPLTAKGKFLFGVGVGMLTMLIRLFSGYPEGVMFAILLMNGVVPLINRWTIPTPLGVNVVSGKW